VANVIASDKTGTLTRNEMTVRTVATKSGRVTLSGAGYDLEGELTRDGGAIEGHLRLETRVRSPSGVRQQRRLQSGRALDRAGRSDRRRSYRSCTQGRLDARTLEETFFRASERRRSHLSES